MNKLLLSILTIFSCVFGGQSYGMETTAHNDKTGSFNIPRHYTLKKRDTDEQNRKGSFSNEYCINLIADVTLNNKNNNNLNLLNVNGNSAPCEYEIKNANFSEKKFLLEYINDISNSLKQKDQGMFLNQKYNLQLIINNVEIQKNSKIDFDECFNAIRSHIKKYQYNDEIKENVSAQNTIDIEITHDENGYHLKPGKITLPKKEPFIISPVDCKDPQELTTKLNEKWLSCIENKIATREDKFTLTLTVDGDAKTKKDIALYPCLNEIIKEIDPKLKVKNSDKIYTRFGVAAFTGLVVGGALWYLNKTNPQLVSNLTNQAQYQLNNFLLNGQYYLGKFQNELSYLYNKIPACKFTWPSFFGRK